ncbi:MAG TPA: hypothetical protein VFS67_07515 [Polyangiaceae bacterium]|nr:hypothetical protein [Polyangiaceae bacterium]
MFKQMKFVGLSLIALGAAAAAVGCTDAPMTSEEMTGLESSEPGASLPDSADQPEEMADLGSGEFAQCANGDGVPSAMAALAAATAKELGRWNPTVDFAPGTAASNWYTTLTSTGKARCSDGKCWNTQAILDLQKSANNVKLSGVVLNANNFVSQLTSNWNNQKNCELRGGTGDTNCSAEQHKLVFNSQKAGACDTVFTYTATSTTGGNLAAPNQLKNKLLFYGGTSNPYLAFSSTGTTVSIDPTYGLDDDGTTSTATCSAACTKMSATSWAGKCCSCSGKTSTYVKSTVNANTYLCQ